MGTFCENETGGIALPVEFRLLPEGELHERSAILQAMRMEAFQAKRCTATLR